MANESNKVKKISIINKGKKKDELNLRLNIINK